MAVNLITIAIPTFQDFEKISGMVDEIEQTFNAVQNEIIYSCQKQSAAKNRNWCLDRAKGDIIIMLDDDISRFQDGWASELLAQLTFDVSLVSARLVHSWGGKQLGADHNSGEAAQIAIHEPTGLQLTCSAAILFRKDDLRFDENYQGAVFEDSDFCLQLRKKYPDKNIVIANHCILEHRNEQKGRTSEQVMTNRKYFNKKWGVKI